MFTQTASHATLICASTESLQKAFQAIYYQNESSTSSRLVSTVIVDFAFRRFTWHFMSIFQDSQSSLGDHRFKNLELKFTKIKQTKQLKHKSSAVFTFLVNAQINLHTLLQVSFYSQARNPVHLHPY